MNPPEICPLLDLILDIAWIGFVAAGFSGLCFLAAAICSHIGK